MKLANLFTLGFFLLTTTAVWARDEDKRPIDPSQPSVVRLGKFDKEAIAKLQLQMRQLDRCKKEMKKHGGKAVSKACLRLQKAEDPEGGSGSKIGVDAVTGGAVGVVKELEPENGSATGDPEGGSGATPKGTGVK